MTNSFLELAKVQRETGTMYCAGLDPHPFGGYNTSMHFYWGGLDEDYKDIWDKLIFPFYHDITRINGLIPQLTDFQKNQFVSILSSVECYLIKVIDILVKKCNVRVFKPQAAFYEQFGSLGAILLSRVRLHIKNLEEDYGRIIVLLDCKRGDIFSTQSAYFLGLMGNLSNSWGVDYTPFDFDIINVTPWMGEDVMVIGNEENPGLGLQLIRQGKGIIVVNKTSNPSGPHYQEQPFATTGKTLQMTNVADLATLSDEYELEASGLSSIGLVVGSTHVCDGSTREAFPGTTLLVPGFGAQGGKFSYIMQELISSGEWVGQGAMFSSSRGTLYPFLKKYGGSGDVRNLEADLIKSIENFRVAEKSAFDEPELKEKGIVYPFN